MAGPDWDAAYRGAGPDGLFGAAPNDWLVMCTALAGLPRGASALFTADGDGRNGRWAAGQGLSVTATDLSAEATRRARAADAVAGVSVTRHVADITCTAPGGPVALAALLYLQGPAALRRAGVAAARAALGPGGLLVLEGFSAAEAGPPGPTGPGLRYAPAELRDWLAGLDLLALTEGEVLLDEGPRHRGPARVLRCLARHPG